MMFEFASGFLEANGTNYKSKAEVFAIGDLDGDLVPDLVVGYYKSGGTRVFLSSRRLPNVQFGVGSDITSHSRNTVAIQLGDVDSDGATQTLLAQLPNNSFALIYAFCRLPVS